MLVTKYSKVVGSDLGVFEDAFDFTVVEGDGGEFLFYVGVGKVKEGGFVEIVENLTVDAVFI